MRPHYAVGTTSSVDSHDFGPNVPSSRRRRGGDSNVTITITITTTIRYSGPSSDRDGARCAGQVTIWRDLIQGHRTIRRAEEAKQQYHYCYYFYSFVRLRTRHNS